MLKDVALLQEVLQPRRSLISARTRGTNGENTVVRRAYEGRNDGNVTNDPLTAVDKRADRRVANSIDIYIYTSPLSLILPASQFHS